MPKLSYFDTLISPSGYKIPLVNSGVNNYQITPSSLISGALGMSSQSGKIAATDGGTIIWVNSGGGASTPGGADTQIQFNSGGSFNGSSNLVYDYTNRRYGFHGPINAAFPVSFTSGIGPSGNNSINFGSASFVWGSGFFNGINFSGAQFNGSRQSGVVYSSGSLLKTSSGLMFEDNLGCLRIGNPPSPSAGSVIHAAGADNTGAGIAVMVENIDSSTNSIANFFMKTAGSNDGTFFGCKNTGFTGYGIVNGITMRPGSSTQDLGLAAGGAVLGTALGPALIIKSDTKICIGDTTGWVASNPGKSQVEIKPYTTTIPALILSVTSSQSEDIFRVSKNSVDTVKVDLSGRLIADKYIVNSSISGAAYTWPIPYGFSIPSGSISGTGTNVTYEIPILYPCILDTSGNYAGSRIHSKIAPSGNSSGLVVDIKYSGNNVGPTSIWSVNSGNRLKIANNVRSGTQSTFDFSGVLQPGYILSLDIVTWPTGVSAGDLIIELATLAQK